MKNIKKLLSIVMVLAMVLALGASALADAAPTQTHEVELVANPGKIFEFYKIFSGGTAVTTNAEGKEATTLGQVDWANGVKSAEFVEALQSDPIMGKDFAGCTEARDVAKVLSAHPEYGDAFAQLAYTNRGELTMEYTIPEEGPASVTLVDGYYLIIEKNDSNDNGVINPALLQLTDQDKVTIKQKADIPTVDKEVADVNDTEGVTEWSKDDSADHDIGDIINFRLTATIGQGYSQFENYYLEFTDTMSKGLQYQNDAKVTITDENGANVTTEFNISAVTGEDGKTVLTVKCDDLKASTNEKIKALTDGSKIVVTYSAKLTTDAVIGVEGNPNTVTLTYSSDPNNTAGGQPPKGTTPPDTVIVFTFDQKVNKVDGTGDALEGAGFTLLKKVASGGSTIKFFEGTANEVSYDGVKKVGEWAAANGKTTFDFDGLDDGEYILVESTVPEGYNRAEDIVFKIEATHIDPDTLTDPNGKALTEFNVYVWDKTAGTAGTGDWVKQEPEGAANQKVLGVTMGAPDGMISGTVVNDSGLELPETGGIGTTIFYVVGAILVVGAVILLVTRKRANDATK